MPNPRPNWLSTIGWAAYLACSWTWCIGMFLPVLLVRDYGVWGFVVFAVPNVIGAAAMGWVLKRPEDATSIATRHRVACLAFTLVTIAFHGFFLAWVLGSRIPPTGPLGGLAWVAVVVVVVLAVVMAVLSALPRARLIGPVIVWLVSMLLCLAFLAANSQTFDGLGAPTRVGLAPPLRSGGDLLLLAPVCVFGFALCPYLDLTFLRARRETVGDQGTAAFTIGFCVLFLAMIMFTLAYAPTTLGYATMGVFAIANFLVVLQFLNQAAFTIGVHSGAALQGSTGLARRGMLALAGSLLFGVLAGALAARMHAPLAWQSGTQMFVGETLYRCFMAFYGLVFPAYVWLCMIPTRDGHSGIDGPAGRRKLTVLATAVAVATPCYWMGFIERVEWWLVPGLLMVLAARLLVRGQANASTSPTTSPTR